MEPNVELDETVLVDMRHAVSNDALDATELVAVPEPAQDEEPDETVLVDMSHVVANADLDATELVAVPQPPVPAPASPEAVDQWRVEQNLAATGAIKLPESGEAENAADVAPDTGPREVDPEPDLPDVETELLPVADMLGELQALKSGTEPMGEGAPTDPAEPAATRRASGSPVVSTRRFKQTAELADGVPTPEDETALVAVPGHPATDVVLIDGPTRKDRR